MDLVDAPKIIDQAPRKAAEIGVPMSIAVVDPGGHAVVDPGGHVIAVARMEGAPFISTETATSTAYTAAAVKVPTSALSEVMDSNPAFAASAATLAHGRFLAAAGGSPVLVDGVLVGAIGVSGGTTVEQGHGRPRCRRRHLILRLVIQRPSEAFSWT